MATPSDVGVEEANTKSASMGIEGNTMGREPSMSRFKKYALFLVALLETILFSGNIFGWAQLAFILKEEGIYSYLCNSNATAASKETSILDIEIEALFKGCKEHDLKFTLAYTLGALIFNSSASFIGIFLYKFGLRTTRLFTVPMNILGFFLLGLTSQDKPHLLFVGVVFLCLGNAGTRAVTPQFADLFPKRRSIALSLISGSFATSTGIFLFIQIATAQGISRSYGCWLFACVSALSIPATFFMPKERIVPYRPDNKSGRTKLMPIKSSLLSVSSFLNYLWVVSFMLNLNIMNTFFNPWISKISRSSQEASLYSKLFSLSTFLSPIYSFVPGFLTDSFTRILSSDGSIQGNKIREIRSCFCSLLITTLLFSTMIGCLFFSTSSAVYIAIFCLSYCRPTLQAVWANFTRVRFPSEHFDRLMGYGFGFSTATPLLAYLVILLAQAYYFEAVSLILCVNLACLVFPLHILSTKYLKKVTQKL